MTAVHRYDIIDEIRNGRQTHQDEEKERERERERRREGESREEEIEKRAMEKNGETGGVCDFT